MEALTALLTRSSAGQLGEPAPTAEQLEFIMKAGMRASDHGRLKPWRFILIEGSARQRLGELFVRIEKEDNPAATDDECRKLANNPLRAPLLIVVVAKVRPHEKIPAIEQVLSAAGAAQLMLLAAHAQGLGGIWRTGKMAYHPHVAKQLGLDTGDQIIGFLYIGTPKSSKPFNEENPDNFLVRWNG